MLDFQFKGSFQFGWLLLLLILFSWLIIWKMLYFKLKGSFQSGWLLLLILFCWLIIWKFVDFQFKGTLQYGWFLLLFCCWLIRVLDIKIVIWHCSITHWRNHGFIDISVCMFSFQCMKLCLYLVVMGVF